MKRSLNDLYLPGILIYQSREIYKQKTTLDAPPFNPNRPIKIWRDPDAASVNMRNITYWDLARNPDTNGFMLDGEGRPYLEMFQVRRDSAMGELNIPDGAIAGNPEVIPIPLRQLRPGESFMRIADSGFGAIPHWDDGVPNDPEKTQGPGATIDLSDRVLLESIYKKVVLGK